MKRLLNYITVCTSLLVFFAQASWAADSYTASYKLQDGETHTAGDLVTVYSDQSSEAVATLTFGFAGEADYNAAVSSSKVSGFSAYTSGNGANGKAAGDQGTAYIINPVYNGTVTVGVVLNASKAFYVLEDGVALNDYNGIMVESKYFGTYSFSVTAGKTYTVTAAGTKLGFYGFTYNYTTDGGGGEEPQPIQLYNLSIGVTPANAGYTNQSATQSLQAGSTINVRAYSNGSEYRFKQWTANGTAVSTSTNFTYTMPEEDVALVAVFDFDPANPADPEVKNTHTLTFISEPAGAGSFNRTSGEKVEAGQRVYINTYNNTGFVFDKWMSADTLLSVNRSFYLTMPDHDAELKAVYHYDPTSPANPDTAIVYYKVVLETHPANAGSFNWDTETDVVANRWNTIYAYANQGYVFREWLRDGESVGTDRSYRFQMPAEHVKLVAVYDYNPSNPSNPNSNYWNPQTGEVIVDDFTPGNLSNAIYNAIGGNSNRDKVQMITVSGPVSQYDWGVVNNYQNCTFLDMSRTYGMTSVPSYNFNGNTVLTSVALPAGIESIEYYAFRGCTNLSSISCYAKTPPTIGDRAFENIGDSIVYVPAEALAQYQEAPGWKDFTILPLSGQVSALEVNLPEGTDPAIYNDMYIELINTKSGQKQRYVVTNRTTYTFNSLIHRTSYNVYLKNAKGDIFGEIDGIDIVDHDVSVTFENLMVPRTLTLSVKTPNGDDVTSQTVITWMDQKDTYLTKGTTLTGQIENSQVKFRVTLPQQLAMQYLLPEDSLYTVLTQNDITYTLKDIPQMTISGKVLNVKTGKAINGATIAISQMLNGLYSKTFTVKTNNQGQWQQTVFEAKSDITASMTDFVSQTLTLETLTAEIPTFELKDINGTTITLNMTYKPVDGEQQSFYNDYTNVTYTIVDKTAQQQVTEFNVQYPQIVLMESLPAGTELAITATSKNGKFIPVTATATVDDKDAASVTLPIVQLGGITAQFSQTENSSVVGILYNGDERLVKKYDYNGAQLTISELTDGEYTLVTMANSQFFNSVATLSQFSGAGLREGVDFVKNKVTVQSGAYTAINNPMIPFLDETKLYYTGGNTSVSLNKSQITVGNYLTLTGRVDFKSAYANSISNVKLIVNLPEESSFVDNSVMVGSSVASYTYEDHKLVIPMDNHSERARFCFIPTDGGSYTATASVQFAMGDKEVTQPIGNVNFTAKDLSINIPTTVAKTNVPVSGMAVSRSVVDIYVDDIQRGHTTALANGSWATTIELDNPYNLSTHSIYAKLTTPTNVEMMSETKEVTYDSNAVQISKVTMYHWNPELRTMFESVFDFQNPSTKPNQWTVYYPNKVFTYTIDFTNNSPEKVTNVVLYVHAADGKVVPLKPIYDESKDIWVADINMGHNSDNYYPVNVSLDYEVVSDLVLDSEMFHKEFNSFASGQNELEEGMEEFNNIYSQWQQAQASGDEEASAQLLQSMMEIVGYGDVSGEILDDETRQQILDDLSEDEAELENLYENILNANQYASDIVSQYMDNVTVKTADGLTVQQLLDEGFEAVEKNDGTSYYVLYSETEWQFVSFEDNLHIIGTGNITQSQALLAPKKSENKDWATQLTDLSKTLNQLLSSIMGTFDGVVERLNKINGETGKLLEDAQGKYSSRYIDGLSPQQIKELEEQMTKYSRKIERNKGIINWLERNVKQYMSGSTTASKFAGKCFSLFNLGMDAKEGLDRLSKMTNLRNAITAPCDEAQAAALDLKSDVNGWVNKTGGYYVAKLLSDIAEVAGINGGLLALIPTGGTSAAAIGAAIGVIVANLVADKVFEKRYESNYKNFEERYRALYKLCGKEPCNGNVPCPPTGDDGGNQGGSKNGNLNGGNFQSGSPNDDVKIDPSGYVYEAVSSNRLQGVTATAYYKETVEDMYGDLHENIVLWNAEEYAQENPLFTDEYGMYQWDVPQGLWQVKFEKEGYQTTYSEWLPVPPPQLEVNIAMTQLLQPSVLNGKAYSGGVELTFDKYMDPETLTTENIMVTKNGNPIEGTIKLLNEEVAYEGETQTYASKIRFEVPAGEELLATDAVQLTVRKAVKSYAGVQMEADYVQDFDVELQVTKVAVDELINVAYGGTRTLTIAALPSDAAKGKKMSVNSLSTMIATANVEDVTLDENGQAEIIVTGELPGSTVLNFAVAGTDVKGMMTVNVKDAANLVAYAPRASRVSGTEVYRGTKIQLSSETENAVIYYTLDGSCPCETSSDKVFVYNPDEPIVVNDDNVTIKAMATGTDLAESEVVEFNYALKKTVLGYQMPAGWTWISHNVETAVPVSEFEENVERILSQTAETVKDPQWGLFGNLTELLPTVGYKVKVNALTNKRLEGVEYNTIENTLNVKTGWNWIGYPLNQVMTIDEALTYFEATAGDYIVGQDGFVEYDGEQWQGTLEGFRPGQGYMFKSATTAEIQFNTNYVSNAVSTMGKRNWLIDSPWGFDSHAYSSAMPVTGEVFSDGTKASDGDYVVGAFVGDECRGIGQWKNGRVMMNVYGENSEAVHFIAYDVVEERYYEIVEEVNFTPDNQGSWYFPMTMTISSEITGMKDLYNELGLNLSMNGNYLTVNAGGKYIDKLTITNTSGVTMLSVSNLGTSATITTGQLPNGVYIVTASADGKTLYNKILKANK